MKVQSAVIIDRAKLKTKNRGLVERYHELTEEPRTLEGQSARAKEIVTEITALGAVSNFIWRELLEEKGPNIV